MEEKIVRVSAWSIWRGMPYIYGDICLCLMHPLKVLLPQFSMSWRDLLHFFFVLFASSVPPLRALSLEKPALITGFIHARVCTGYPDLPQIILDCVLHTLVNFVVRHECIYYHRCITSAAGFASSILFFALVLFLPRAKELIHV